MRHGERATMRKQLPLLGSAKLLMPCAYSTATHVRLVLHPETTSRSASPQRRNTWVPLHLTISRGKPQHENVSTRIAKLGTEAEVSARCSRPTVEERDGMARRGRLTKGNAAPSLSLSSLQAPRHSKSSSIIGYLLCVEPTGGGKMEGVSHRCCE